MAILKENSKINKTTGLETIATIEDIDNKLIELGGGDMLKSVYDPNDRNKDIFNYNNLDNRPSIPSITGLASETYVNNKVKTDVPVDAIFTDTKYEHPSTHPASMITETIDKRFVTDTEKQTWNDKWDYSENTIKAVKVNNAVDADTVNGKTVGVDVPANAEFTDTKYTAGDNITIDGTTIKAQDTVYTHPTHTAKSSGLYKITVNNLGHVSDATAVTKSDITGLDIPGQDTTYDNATISTAGLMSGDDKTKLDSVATGAQKNSDITKAEIEAKLIGEITSHTHDYLPSDGEAVSAATASKLGSVTVGSGVKPIYLNAGTATASTSTVGSATRPVYLNSGTITQGTHTIQTSVPANAKFTDTVYVHPTSDGNLHVPATGTTNNGKVLKAGATAGSLVWGTDNDTITTINGKTGTITKADIVALGIPAQDTVYTHPAGTNPHGTTKADVGLGNVDNTSDANKPVSTAQATAINAKYTKPALGIPKTDLVTDVQTSLGKADTALQSFTETDPTVPSWAKQTNKPNYTATEVGAIPASQKGANNGVAELDSSGKVLSSQLPSYVDDVLEYATSTNFPATGESGKIYIAVNTNLTYRWTGTAYTEISPSIALGETSATAYRGDRGKIAYNHSQTTHAPSNAQKNSDITKAEIEAKLTGNISTHTHNQYIESSKFQVVESLPASPVSGTFYFVKE